MNRRGLWRTVAAVVATLAAVLALQAPAAAATNLDQFGWVWGYPTQTPLETYTASMANGWWNAVGIRSFYYDYDLAVSTGDGIPLATSQMRSSHPDFVAINNNTTDGCFVSYNVTAQIVPVAPVSTPPPGNPQDIASPQWTINKSGRQFVYTDPISPPGLRYQTVYNNGDRPVEIFDVRLVSGVRYRVGWNNSDPAFVGALYLFAPDPNQCVFAEWNAKLVITSATVGPFDVEFTANITGWYGLAITMENTFNTLTTRPTVLVKAVG
jgi:hypothetical protein